MSHHRLVRWERWGYEGWCGVGRCVSGMGLGEVRGEGGILRVVTGVLIHITTSAAGGGGLRTTYAVSATTIMMLL